MKSARRGAQLLVVLLGVVVLVLGLALNNSVQAVDAGNSYIRCDRMKAGVAPGNCLVVFTTSATAAVESSIKITLDSEWASGTNFSATATNYTVTTTGIPADTTAMPNIATANDVTGNSIRFPASGLAESTKYAFIITGGLLLNPAASNTQQHIIATRTGSDAATADTKTVAMTTISDDQIVVTATVAPVFTFVFNNNAQNLGTLSTTAPVSGGGTTVTVSTNATGGWNAWALSANAGLKSAAAGNYTIATTGTVNNTPDSLSNGAEGYVLDVDMTTNGSGAGTPTIAAEYNGTTTTSGGTLSTSYQLIASSDGVTAGDVITLIPRASISGLTPAATDYTDTLTVVGAGTF